MVNVVSPLAQRLSWVLRKIADKLDSNELISDVRCPKCRKAVERRESWSGLGRPRWVLPYYTCPECGEGFQVLTPWAPKEEK
jgi:ssDNA-binding Zn-finger/Zn-ribbon topoisomerase 1